MGQTLRMGQELPLSGGLAGLEPVPDAAPVGFAAAMVGLACWATALCWWDMRHRRLPDVLTIPAGAASLFLIFFAPHLVAHLLPHHLPVWHAFLGLMWPALYVALAITRGGIGGGDIKLALPLGIACAACGGMLAVLGAMVAAALWTLIHAVFLRARGSRRPPAHGPGMLLGSAIACGWAPFMV
ncbi:prepilin peptidase [Corynebacterium flavescens]